MAEKPRIRILNVDGDAAGRYATSRVLAAAGFEVIEAATGAEALARSRQQPDLIVLDVQLPDMSGFDVCKRIKTTPETAAIPVPHLSATYVAPSFRADGLEGGADGYLVQPVDPREFVATIRALLRIKKAERALRASEEQFRSALENAAVGVHLVNLDGTTHWVNETVLQHAGLHAR